MSNNRLYNNQDRLDKLLRKDFRDFRRSIDQINYKIAQQVFKNVILEDPRDKRLMETEAKKQWNVIRAGVAKKKKENKHSDDLHSSLLHMNKYSDTVVSEAVSRRDTSQDIKQSPN